MLWRKKKHYFFPKTVKSLKKRPLKGKAAHGLYRTSGLDMQVILFYSIKESYGGVTDLYSAVDSNTGLTSYNLSFPFFKYLIAEYF